MYQADKVHFSAGGGGGGGGGGGEGEVTRSSVGRAFDSGSKGYYSSRLTAGGVTVLCP